MNASDKLYADTENANTRRTFGMAGGLLISDTNAHVNRFIAIKADGAADAVIATLVTQNGDDLTTWTLLAGDILFGDFTSITLTSGKVYAYYANVV